MTTELTSRQAAPDPEEAPQPVAIPSFRQALDQTPLYANEHASGEVARELMQFHQGLRDAAGVTLEDIKACVPGTSERAILLENYMAANLENLVRMPPEQHQPRPLALIVEPEVEPETTYAQELDAIKASPGGDRVRLFADLLQRRGVFSPSG